MVTTRVAEHIKPSEQRTLSFIRTAFPFVSILGAVYVLALTYLTGFLSISIFWFGLYFSVYFGVARSKESKFLFELFAFPFIFYTIYMSVTTYVLVDNPETDFFYAIDSTKFWVRSQEGTSITNIWNAFKEKAVGLESVGGFRFFYLITLVTSFLSGLIDQNNIYVQKLIIVFVGSIASPFIYLVLRKYTNSCYAYLSTLLFVIFSHASTFSVEFLRDIYVYFFYVIGAYLVAIKGGEKVTLFKLLVIALLVFFTRPEHGVFFLMFVGAYVYLNRRSNRLLFAFLLILTPAILYLSSFLISMSLETYSNYDEIRQRVGDSTDSLAARFARFPFGIKHIILAFLSQTVGIPFWRYLSYEGNDLTSVAARSHNGWRFMEAISGTWWIFVWGYVVYAFKKGNFLKKHVPNEILVLLVVAIGLLLAATADVNVRRIFCVYPLIFFVAAIVRYNSNPSNRSSVIRGSFFFIIFMYLVYFVLKG